MKSNKNDLFIHIFNTIIKEKKKGEFLMIAFILIIGFLIFFLTGTSKEQSKTINDRLNGDKQLMADVIHCIGKQFRLENKKLINLELVLGNRKIMMLGTAITEDIVSGERKVEVLQINNSNYLIEEGKVEKKEGADQVHNYCYMPLPPKAWQIMKQANVYTYTLLIQSYGKQNMVVQSPRGLDAHLEELFSSTDYTAAKKRENLSIFAA